MSNMKKILLIGLSLVTVIIGVIIALKVVGSSNPTGKTYVVVLKKDGFVPNMLRLKKGDTIQFKTELGEPFWPASNLHPTHGIFPEFDPKKAVPPNESWSFQFNKTGQWGFHDHIAPQFTGKIIVTK